MINGASFDFDCKCQYQRKEMCEEGDDYQGFDAQQVFDDPKRIIIRDGEHEKGEKRFFCMGLVKGGILTVRFSFWRKKIRIFGAAYWRQGRKRYEEENKIY